MMCSPPKKEKEKGPHPADLIGPGHLGILGDLRDHALVRLEVDCNLEEVSNSHI